MDIYQTDPTKSPNASGASLALGRAAGRLGLSMVWSVRYLEPAAVEHFRNLITPSTLWVLAIILAGWVIATVVGGPIALVINGLLAAYGLYQLYEQLALTWQNLKSWALAAYHAKNDAELDKAAQLFAQAATDGALALLEILITHRIFKSVEGSLRKKYPPPEWMKSEYDRVLKEFDEKQRKPAEKVAEQKRVAPKGEAERVAERRRAFDGGKPPLAPPPLPTAGDSTFLALSVGAIGLIATGTAIAWLAQPSRGRKRS